MGQVTEADFARYCINISRVASSWAGEMLQTHTRGEPVRPHATEEFLDEIRGLLDFIETQIPSGEAKS
jgi:hypothetical protein